MATSTQLKIIKKWLMGAGSQNYLSATKELKLILESLKKLHKKQIVYPPKSKIFRAFSLTPFKKVKVVILGQDPYHGEGQADGLAFSVPAKVKIPPSLRNILKELNQNHPKQTKETGSLEMWAKQGVLLLNSILSVEASNAASHRHLGWESFTDFIIETISNESENVVFILWGGYAQKKKSLIDSERHLVLTSPHPSPLSSYRGFFGSKPFKKTNSYLKKHGREVIDWHC